MWGWRRMRGSAHSVSLTGVTPYRPQFDLEPRAVLLGSSWKVHPAGSLLYPPVLCVCRQVG